MERTKPPNRPRRVGADGITVEQDGATYYPHAGEWVEFKGRPSVGLFLAFSSASQRDEALALLLENLHDWSLTDDAGQPYERPPSLGALMRMGDEEIAWLLLNVRTVVRPEDARGNAFTPST